MESSDTKLVGQDANTSSEPLSSEMKEALREDLKQTYFRLRESDFREIIRRYTAAGNLYLEDPTIAPQLLDGEYQDYCNKPTTVYWLASANYKFTGMPSACIYKQWFHCHSLEPDFEFGHYFANVVRVSSTGPASVSSLLRMHASLYEQITSLHTRLGSGEMARVDKARGMVWPDPDYYKPMPLCRAIITVLD